MNWNKLLFCLACACTISGGVCSSKDCEPRHHLPDEPVKQTQSYVNLKVETLGTSAATVSSGVNQIETPIGTMNGTVIYYSYQPNNNLNLGTVSINNNLLLEPTKPEEKI